MDGVRYSDLIPIRAVDITPDDQFAVLDVENNLLKRANIDHASDTTAFGIGDASKFGHVRIENDLNATTYTDGVALSAYQGGVLGRALGSVEISNTASAPHAKDSYFIWKGTYVKALANIAAGGAISTSNTEATNASNEIANSSHAYKWTAVVRGRHWSSICAVIPDYAVEGTSGIITISATRANVVVNATFLVTTSHAGPTASSVQQLGANCYSTPTVRIGVNTNGNFYFQINDSQNSISESTYQNYHCIYIPLLPATVRAFTTYQSGDVLPDGYEVYGGAGGFQGICQALGAGAHAEGHATKAHARASHAEGFITTATAQGAHSEGGSTVASAAQAHAEGSYATASGDNSHAEGSNALASGTSSHAEGNSTTASGLGAHAEGTGTSAAGSRSHAEGYQSMVVVEQYDSMYGSHAEGYKTTCGPDGSGKHSEGYQTSAYGTGVHAEGVSTVANGGYGAHAEGQQTSASATCSHAEGTGSIVYRLDATSNGSAGHAEGKNTTVVGETGHAEGASTIAFGTASHAEGHSTTASGTYSHAEGNSSVASNTYSHAEGFKTTSDGTGTHAEGQKTSAHGTAAHAEGSDTSANSNGHAEGESTLAGAGGAHAEGRQTYATANNAHAEGHNTTASSAAAHAEGTSTIARSSNAHAEGNGTVASNNNAHAEGESTVAAGTSSHSEGSHSYSSGMGSHAEGFSTTASNTGAHSEGTSTLASGIDSHAEGSTTTASANYSHAEGSNTSASAIYAHTEGHNTTASGTCAHAEGDNTTASNANSHAMGHYNAAMTNGGASTNKNGTALVIGNGTGVSALSNAFSVQFNGVVKAASTITASTVADYAEYFEWSDRNLGREDRVGHFVTFDKKKKIRIATPEDTYILGVVSGQPFVLGNGDCDTWNGMYLRDKFNRLEYEPAPKVEIDPETGEEKIVKDENGDVVYEGVQPKLNPNYNPRMKYISRSDRPEWAPIGMLGVLAVLDDGTCEEDGYATIGQGGIATKALPTSILKYRVIQRNATDVVEIVFR